MYEELNKTPHKVETQWHYKILIKYGFQPLTLIAKGLVRKYDYENKEGFRITGSTGYNADYFITETGQSGFWRELEPFLKNRVKGK